MRLFTLLTLFTAFALTGCARRPAYIVQDFEERTDYHQTVAILPFSLAYTGRLPKGWTEADAERLRKDEAVLLQTSLQSEILRRGRFRNRSFRVDFLGTTTVNGLLRDAGIEPHLAYQESPIQLAEILGVEALVFTAVNKERYLSDEASLAIGTANQVLTSVVANNPLTGILGQVGRTFTVDMDVELVNREGITLYNDRSQIDIDWATTPNESIEIISNQISRSFPYRTFGGR